MGFLLKTLRSQKQIYSKTEKKTVYLGSKRFFSLTLKIWDLVPDTIKTEKISLTSQIPNKDMNHILTPIVNQ